jgi:hypothetical protein
MLIEGDRQVLSADIVRLCGWEVVYIEEMRFTSAFACRYTYLRQTIRP